MRYIHTTTVLDDAGNEKKQPANLYNWTLQGYTGFRKCESSDGSVGETRLTTSRLNTRVRDGDAHHDDIILFTRQRVNYGLTFMITFNNKNSSNKNW